MSWIKEQGPEVDSGLASLYAKYQARMGTMSPVVRATTLKPAMTLAIDQLSDVIAFGGSSLGRRREEMILTHVASILNCHY